MQPFPGVGVGDGELVGEMAAVGRVVGVLEGAAVGVAVGSGVRVGEGITVGSSTVDDGTGNGRAVGLQEQNRKNARSGMLYRFTFPPVEL